jgi:hypothetical protein
MMQGGAGSAVGRLIAALIAMPMLTGSTIAAENKPPIPDFSGIWWHPSLPGFEPLIGSYRQLVGDYTNLILQPWAAEVVKQHGEISMAGVSYPNPANQCWPEPVPFIYKNFGLQILQQPHQITLLYEQDHEARHVRMNEPHPAHVTRSWYGDSVGHYEGDMLVVDTVGQKAGPFAMLDLYGTPYSPLCTLWNAIG